MRGTSAIIAGCAAGLIIGAASPVRAVSIDVSSPSAPPGGTAEFRVTVSTADQQVAVAISEVIWDPRLPIAVRSDGSPDCQFSQLFDPLESNTLSVLQFQPTQCPPGGQECRCVWGEDCVKVRAVNLQTTFEEPHAVRDGTLLYRCRVPVPFDAPQGSYPLRCADPQLSNPKGVPFDGTGHVCTGDAVSGCETDADCTARICDGDKKTACTQDADCATAGAPCLAAAGGTCTIELPAVTCTDGAVVVSGSPLPTPSQTPTAGGGGGGGGGCQLSGSADSRGSAWLLLVCGVLAVRRFLGLRR